MSDASPHIARLNYCLMAVRAFAEKCFANAYLLLTVTTFFFAGNAVAGRLAAGLLTPVTLTFLRWTIATALILILARRHLHRDLGVLGRQWPSLSRCRRVWGKVAVRVSRWKSRSI